MARKGENIYKRKDGRWEGRYKKGRKENGQIYYGYLYGKTYTEVKQRLYSYKLKYQLICACQGESSVSYEDWCLSWLTQQQPFIKPSTYATYLYKLKNYVFESIGDCRLNQLTNQTIQQWVDTLTTKGLQPRTIHTIYRLVQQTLVAAKQQQRLQQVPCEAIRLPKIRRKKVEALSTSQQQRLERQAKEWPLRKAIVPFLALDAGLRIGEIAALRWQDIDFTNKCLHISNTYQRICSVALQGQTQLVLTSPKTAHSNRMIPLSDTLYRWLKKLKKQAKGLFVCSAKARPCEPRLLTYYFHQLRKRCGLEAIHFHQLRHTFATRCMEAHVDIASVSQLMGHASTRTTLDVYTDSLVESRYAAIQQMEAHKN